MQTRYMTRTNSMKANGKRSLEDGSGSEMPEREKKRPTLASVIVEALKVDSLQKLCSSLEPILRRVVSEEVERALAKLGPARIDGRSSPKRIEGRDGRNLQLVFKSRVSLPLYTGGKVEGEQRAAIHVVLVDASTGIVVTSGPESYLKLDVVVLEGNFNNEDDEGWTEEEFESHIVKEREGKRPLLTGDLQVTLKEGVGTLGDLIFTDNSSWIRSRKFRLGLKVASGYCEGIRIREARTEAFAVRDHRGELYKKHYPPALHDEVWRLEKIGKDGSFHKKLTASRIYTVEDFLRLMVRDCPKLRNILGSGMSNKMWDALIQHANTCVLSGKLYVYYTDDTHTVAVVFNNIYELSGLIVNEQYYSADSLSDNQKVYVDSLMNKAYDNWDQVMEYDGKSLVDFKQNKKPSIPRIELSSAPNSYPHSSINDHRLQRHVPMEQNMFPEDSSYQESLNARYSSQSSLTSHDSRSQFTPTPFTQSNQPANNLDPTNYALSPSPFQIGSSSLHHANINLFENWSSDRNKSLDEFLSEEEIRMRSHEILESEDIQHLLRLYSMGNHTSVNMTNDGYNFHSDISGLGFNENRTRPGKAVAGWLKIKAAMRWGIFVRKKAAERRARIEELDED